MSWLSEARFRVAVAMGTAPAVATELARIDAAFRAAEARTRLTQAMQRTYMAVWQAQQACNEAKWRLQSNLAEAQVAANAEIRIHVFGIKPDLAAAIERCGRRP